jgi:hypothetical protein
LPLFLEEEIGKGAVFPEPGSGNQATVEDKIEVKSGNQATVEDKTEVKGEVPTPARPYSPRIQGSIFQKNEIQGINKALREDKSPGLEPLSRYFFRTQKREDSDNEDKHQAKQVRAILALLALEVKSEKEDEPTEFTLVAMP